MKPAIAPMKAVVHMVGIAGLPMILEYAGLGRAPVVVVYRERM
jgi:hypothetical protein